MGMQHKALIIAGGSAADCSLGDQDCMQAQCSCHCQSLLLQLVLIVELSAHILAVSLQ
jgi:hypothetical protein